jgi:predicted dithiol-disulfide oxidoreductase (DUF899 family)
MRWRRSTPLTPGEALMFGEDWAVACPGCSSLADGLGGVVRHLNDRDVTLLCMSHEAHAIPPFEISAKSEIISAVANVVSAADARHLVDRVGVI